jgi:hypothetical protein
MRSGVTIGVIYGRLLYPQGGDSSSPRSLQCNGENWKEKREKLQVIMPKFPNYHSTQHIHSLLYPKYEARNGKPQTVRKEK